MSVILSDKEAALVLKFLEYATDKMGNAGCNDIEKGWLEGWTKEEIREAEIEQGCNNLGKPREEFTAEELEDCAHSFGFDFIVGHWLEHRIEKAGWQPIETAPKDGRSLLLCVKGFEPFSGQWYTMQSPNDMSTKSGWVDVDPQTFEDDSEFWGWFTSWDIFPTHWMPLLEGPK